MERKGKKLKSKGKAPGGDRYDVILTDGGDRKIEVAKIFNEISGMRRVGAELQEIFSRPTLIKGGVTKDEAAQIRRKIEGAGGSVKMTPARG
jgi:large subunit ribosomal protein L7/L12